MVKSRSSKPESSAAEFEQIRSLILGKNNHIVTDTIKEQARPIVSDVITETLHDRQKKDGSINKALLPLLESSIEHSVSQNGERLAGSLYPIMGNLVRKYIAAFLTDFMEKTNQLLENSFTIKGLKWRLAAKQAGISFAQYAASQTFIYRVEHVLLIHRETGLLLNSVALNEADKTHADLISSMLTAINDFVGDSFSASTDGLKEQLQTVSTDNFNLLIKPGPSALVVAAVMGNPPQRVSDQIQLTLEEIHNLYHEELTHFSGDNSDFINSENLLRDCLLTEQKQQLASKQSPPWLAWLLISSFLLYFSYHINHWWHQQQLLEQVSQIDLLPGINLHQVSVNSDDTISLTVLRDPSAVAINDWLEQNNLPLTHFVISERHYHSLDLKILQIKVKKILENFSGIKHQWQGDLLYLTGNLTAIKHQQLINQLQHVGLTTHQLNISQLTISTPNFAALNHDLKLAAFKEIIGRISAVQLHFTRANEQVSAEMEHALHLLYLNLQELNSLASSLNKNVGLMILGTSDSTGSKANNHKLSIQRANNAKHHLTLLGAKPEQLYVTGLGQIELEGIENSARKVIFNVIYIDNTNN